MSIIRFWLLCMWPDAVVLEIVSAVDHKLNATNDKKTWRTIPRSAVDKD